MMHADPTHAVIIGLLILLVVAVFVSARRSHEGLGGGGFSVLTGLDWYNSKRVQCDERGCYVEGPVLF